MYDPNALRPAPPYRHVAWCYDALASAYSLGAIDRAKAWHARLITRGDLVLYAGAGCGREIVRALLNGAEVTCVEPSAPMAMRLHRRLSAEGNRFTIVPKPVQALPTGPSYDLVVAHFFLNVFSKQAMPGILEHLSGFVRPGGQLVIADFAPNRMPAGVLDRSMRGVYYYPLNSVGRMLRICASHPIYDYQPLLLDRGFVIERVKPYRVLPVLPALYEVIVARRPVTR